MAWHSHGRPRCRPQFRTPLRFDSTEQLLVHRELEYLRAAALPRDMKGRAKRVRERARKLDQAASITRMERS
jgi:hypothetical protein